MKAFFFTALMLICAAPLAAQSNIDGPWHGAISIGGMAIDINVRFASQGDSLSATIDVPQQGAQGLELKRVSRSGDSVHFELPSGLGLAAFDGARAGDSIAGSFHQGGGAGTFTLARGEAPKPQAVVEEHVPYRHEEVTFKNGDVTLAGTLTIPRGKGPFPAVVMITGSGPQNRDEELFGFKPFRVIADHFTRHGIAVLRYDDRGIGGSTGSVNQSTTSDFASDALSAVELLKSRSDIDSKHIGLMGHSEGGIVAPLAATRSKDVAFIVLMAGTGISGEQLLYAQGKAIALANGATEDAVGKEQKEQQRIFQAVRTGTLDSLKRELRAEAQADLDKLPQDQRKSVGSVDDLLDAQLRSVSTPWFKYFLDYDPAVALAKVKVPVLMFFGEHDLQVPAELNRVAMVKALESGGNKRFKAIVLPKANHLFLTSATGNPMEYATMKKEFVPGFLDAATSWIQRQTGASKK
jgi:hypothetical protein